ncbi:amylovoran biosynthesis protein AmsD [Bacteroidia bacterium]|nr:amylovoran biosynthesis protein AmsD [Bacteroidia bacterium]
MDGRRFNKNTMKGKKILFLIPSLIPGGMERVMSEIVTYCANHKNDEIHLILYGRKHDSFFSIPEQVCLHKHDIEYRDNKRFQYTIQTFLYLRKEIKKINPDTILSFGELWNNFVLMATIGLKYPVYISDRCQPNKKFSRKQEILKKYLYPKAKGVILQTRIAEDIYCNKYKIKNSKIIGNPIREIDTDRNIKQENIIISIGRLISSKHYDRLIDIFAKINDPNWKLVIVGDDAIKQSNSINLHNCIKKLNKEDAIILTGSQKDIESYLLKSKIFAFTSSSEGFPNVIGEAMSAGLPVVSYNCIAGPSEMIEDGKNGFLIPLFDDALFEEKLRYLMEHEEGRKQMGLMAKKSIKKFDLELICEEFYQFIVNDK